MPAPSTRKEIGAHRRLETAITDPGHAPKQIRLASGDAPALNEGALFPRIAQADLRSSETITPWITSSRIGMRSGYISFSAWR